MSSACSFDTVAGGGDGTAAILRGCGVLLTYEPRAAYRPIRLRTGAPAQRPRLYRRPRPIEPVRGSRLNRPDALTTTPAMALRISSTPRAEPLPTSRAEWRRRVDAACADAAAALRDGNLDALAAIYANAAGWEDPFRAQQLRIRATELVLAHRPR